MSKFPKRLVWDVSKADINASKPGDKARCVISNKARREFPEAKFFVTDMDGLKLSLPGVGRAHYELDAAALKSIARNDAKRPLRPFQTVLTRLEMKEMQGPTRDAESYEKQKQKKREQNNRYILRKSKGECDEMRRVNGYVCKISKATRIGG